MTRICRSGRVLSIFSNYSEGEFCQERKIITNPGLVENPLGSSRGLYCLQLITGINIVGVNRTQLVVAGELSSYSFSYSLYV